MHEIRSSVTSGFLWRFFERSGAQLITFIVSIVLARLLEPEVYGKVALVTILITLLQVFVDSGMGNALIQKKDADHLDFSTVFLFNLFVCVVLYVLVFLAAPHIASFYDNQELTLIIRVLSLMIIVSGIRNIQQAYISKHLLFKRFFYSSILGTIAAAIVGLGMAFSGYGIWALVAQQLTNVVVSTIVLWIVVKWRPQLEFSWSRLKGLFSFGWKLLLSSLLDTGYNELRQLIIGKRYSSTDLAFYNRGQQFPQFIANNINASIDSVLLPTMSRVQDDKSVVKVMTRRAIKTSVYLMAPLMMGLAAMADTVVKLLLTDAWLESVPYLRIFCISYMFFPIHTANLNAIKAIGRSDLFLKLEIIKKVVGITILLSTMHLGVLVMALSSLASSFLGQIINSWPNNKLLNYSYLDQIKDIFPSILLAVIMGLIIWPMGYLLGSLPTLALVVLQILAGAAIYVLGSFLFKLEPFFYVLNMLRDFLNHRKQRQAG